MNEKMRCEWHYEDGIWITECGSEFQLNDGTPKENGMIFCHKCGKKIYDASRIKEGVEKHK